MFEADRMQVRTWLKNEEIIQQQKYSSKAFGRVCTSKYPIIKDALYAEYKEVKFLKRWWFNTRSKQLLKDHYPGKELKSSDQWFMRFCRRYGVALRRKAHAAQTDPKKLAPEITKFHSNCCVSADVVFTKLKTSQTWTKHHYRLYLTMDDSMMR